PGAAAAREAEDAPEEVSRRTPRGRAIGRAEEDAVRLGVWIDERREHERGTHVLAERHAGEERVERAAVGGGERAVAREDGVAPPIAGTEGRDERLRRSRSPRARAAAVFPRRRMGRAGACGRDPGRGAPR